MESISYRARGPDLIELTRGDKADFVFRRVLEVQSAFGTYDLDA